MKRREKVERVITSITPAPAECLALLEAANTCLPDKAILD